MYFILQRPCGYKADQCQGSGLSLQGLMASPGPSCFCTCKEHPFKPVERDSDFDRKDPNLQVPRFMLGLEFKTENKELSGRRHKVLFIVCSIGVMGEATPGLGYFCQWGQRGWSSPRVRGGIYLGKTNRPNPVHSSLESLGPRWLFVSAVG